MDSIASGVPASCHSDDTATAGQLGLAIESWAAVNLREFPWRAWTDLYRLTVTEVLLQQTAAPKVAAFVASWFERYPSWAELAAAPAEELEAALLPLGLHRRRAATLNRLALSFVEGPSADMASRPGVGQYISRAVAVALRGEAVAMVDVNFVRILHRAFDGPWKADYRYDSRLQALALAVVEAATDARTINWAVLDLAAKVCKAGRPRCPACPIMDVCRTGSMAGAVP